ncbi:DUF892 family protein [bacterium]|nr:MAG: DUF892 family protein [bacterium]
MAETPKERVVRYLQDAHAAATGADQAIEGYIDDTSDPAIKAVFSQNRTSTQAEAQRIEARLRALGEEPSGGKGFLNMIMAKVSELMHGAHDEYDKNTQNIIKAYALSHLERGMYQSLYSYSSAIGDAETAALAQTLQGENEAAAARLFPLIDTYAKTALAGTAGTGVAYTA